MKILKYILVGWIISMPLLVHAGLPELVYDIVYMAMEIYGSTQRTGSFPPSNQIREECEKYMPRLGTLCISEECMRGLPACYAVEDMNKIYMDIYGTWPGYEVIESFISTYIYEGETRALYQLRLPAISSLYQILCTRDPTLEEEALAQNKLGSFSNWRPFSNLKAEIEAQCRTDASPSQDEPPPLNESSAGISARKQAVLLLLDQYLLNGF